jgi:sterol desaturase/sphingolipid hydroxylase (fatty acid hydroxylase superfamily)
LLRSYTTRQAILGWTVHGFKGLALNGGTILESARQLLYEVRVNSTQYYPKGDTLHLFWDVAIELAGLSILFMVGFVLEQINPVERVFDAPALARNYVVGYFYLFGQELALMGLGFLLVHSWHGLFSIGTTDGGLLGRAVYLSLLWMLARDFFYYWFHRLQHASRWLWAEHAVHHSDEYVNATTAVRHHWLETPLMVIFVFVPLNILFRPPAITYPMVAAVVSWVGMINHMNIRVGFGSFAWLISSPQNHRIHHSRQPGHMDKNFAAFFPIWDVIFGTYYSPRKGEYPATGLSSGQRVTSIAQALMLPFKMWRKMLSD